MGDLLVLCKAARTCYRAESAFFRFSYLAEQRGFPLGLHTVCAKRADSVYARRMFDRTEDKGDMSDQEHGGARGGVGDGKHPLRPVDQT